MDPSNCQTIPKQTLPNQSVFCPWISRAPLAQSAAVRQGTNCSDQQANAIPQLSVNCQQTMINQSRFNNHQINPAGLTNVANPSGSLHYPSIQQSSSQFFHFLRLMQLFPDIHPATLHTVLVLCKSDFFCAVDKLLYAKRCKQMYNNRRNLLETSKFNRHKPYCCIRPTIVNSGTSSSGETLQQSSLVLQSFNQMLPLDVSFKKMHNNDDRATASCSSENESGLKGKTAELRKILPRNRVKSKDKRFPLSNSTTDLPPVASPQCNLPIRPLSPMTAVPEDLSSQASSM